MILDKLFSQLDRLACKWLDKRMDQVIRNGDPELQKFDLHRAEYRPGSREIIAFAPSVVVLADQAAKLLKGSENYIEFDMMPRLDRGMRPVRVTVQWASGQSPAQKNSVLTKENQELSQKLSIAEERLNWLARTAKVIWNDLNELGSVDGEVLDGLYRQLREMGLTPEVEGEKYLEPRLEKLTYTCRMIVKAVWGNNQMPDQTVMDALWAQLHELKELGYMAGEDPVLQETK